MVQWKKQRITATGLVSGISAGNTYGGIITQAVGTTTTITVYDDTSAVAASLITPVTTTATTNVAGVFTPPIGSSVGTLTSVPPNDGWCCTRQRSIYYYWRYRFTYIHSSIPIGISWHLKIQRRLLIQ